MTVDAALACGVPDAARLLAWVLGEDRAWLIAHGDAPLGAEPAASFEALCRRRAAGEPLAYLLESAGFFGREFLVNSSVLIPRPETEHLVEASAAFLRARERRDDCVRALDLGVGSGAVACTLAGEVPDARVDATDVSADALEVARRNAEMLGVATRCTFFLGDLLAPLPPDRSYDAIVANLPYVPTADIASAPDPVSFEPRLALDGGADGLALYRRLLSEVASFMLPGGLLLLEAAPPLIVALVSLAQAALPRAQVTVGLDYGRRQRFVRVLAE